MKTTVLFCVFLIAAATASEKTVRRAAGKGKASSRFKQDVAAPNRPNPLKPFPDTPRQPDLDFIRTKVAELVKDFHIDQEQADMVIGLATEVGINQDNPMTESDLTIDQKDRVKRSMEELVRNIPAHVWSKNKTAPKRGTSDNELGFVYLKHDMFDASDSGPHQNCTVPTATRYTLINTCQPVASKDAKNKAIWAMATCDAEGAALTHFGTPNCVDHADGTFDPHAHNHDGRSVTLEFGQCYHGMVRYDNCTTDVPKRPANAGQVVVELFFNKHTCEAGDAKPAPEIWVMNVNKENNRILCGDIKNTFAWQTCKGAGCHTIAGGNTGECVHTAIPADVGAPPYVSARVTGCE